MGKLAKLVSVSKVGAVTRKISVIGDLARLEVLNPKDIEIYRSSEHHSGYQRDITAFKHKRIAGDNVLNLKAFGVISVARRKDGTLWAMDGQNRLKFAIDAGLKLVNCVVSDVESDKEEAKIFDIINRKRNPLTPYEIHKAVMCHGEDEIENNIISIMDEFGIALVERTKQGVVTDEISCIGVIREAYKKANSTTARGNGIIIRKTMEFLINAFNDDVDRFKGTTFQASTIFIKAIMDAGITIQEAGDSVKAARMSIKAMNAHVEVTRSLSSDQRTKLYDVLVYSFNKHSKVKLPQRK
jgi:hypothetical protein